MENSEVNMLITLVSEKIEDLEFDLKQGRFYSISLGRPLKDGEMGKKKLQSKQRLIEKIIKYKNLKSKLINMVKKEVNYVEILSKSINMAMKK